MQSFLIILGVAILTSAMWGIVIDPLLEKRPRKAIFVKPRNISRKLDDKDKNNKDAYLVNSAT